MAQLGVVAFPSPPNSPAQVGVPPLWVYARPRTPNRPTPTGRGALRTPSIGTPAVPRIPYAPIMTMAHGDTFVCLLGRGTYQPRVMPFVWYSKYPTCAFCMRRDTCIWKRLASLPGCITTPQHLHAYMHKPDRPTLAPNNRYEPLGLKVLRRMFQRPGTPAPDITSVFLCPLAMGTRDDSASLSPPLLGVGG